MTQKEIMALKSRFEDFAGEFRKHISYIEVDDGSIGYTPTMRDMDLILAAINAGKCDLIADLIGDRHLLEQCARLADKLAHYYC